MKAYLKFDLPEDREDMLMAQRACEYYCMLEDVRNYARSLDKYDDRESVPIDEVVSKLRELIEGYENN